MEGSSSPRRRGGRLLISAALVRTVVALASEYIPRADEIALDWTVLLFAGGCALLSTALASLAPLWQAVRTVPADALGDGVRATASARSRRLSHSLVVGESRSPSRCWR